MLCRPVKCLRKMFGAQHSVAALFDAKPLYPRIEPQEFLGIRAGYQFIAPGVYRQHVGAVPDVAVTHLVKLRKAFVKFIRKNKLLAHFNAESVFLASSSVKSG